MDINSVKEAKDIIDSFEKIIKSQSDLILKKDEEISILINHIKLLKNQNAENIQKIMTRSLN
ncbi:MAG: hypothetical protein RLZZ479_244 [Bacteroidota bacterium]|jgi:predicted helicase